MVFAGLVTACRFAVTPTFRSPFFPTAVMEGVVRIPSAFSRTRGCPPSTTAIAEFVVPKSIPSILLMLLLIDYYSCGAYDSIVHRVAGADFLLHLMALAAFGHADCLHRCRIECLPCGLDAFDPERMHCFYRLLPDLPQPLHPFGGGIGRGVGGGLLRVVGE